MKLAKRNNAEPTLRDIAKQIKAEWKTLEGALRSSLERAIAIGDLLLKVKERTKHGEFVPWVEKHCPFTRQHASKLIRLANYANGTQKFHLTQREALRALMPPGENGKGEAAEFVVLSLASATKTLYLVRAADDRTGDRIRLMFEPGRN